MDNNKIFYSYDYDLNNMNKESLKLCCEYNLLIETPFPKLVIYLFYNPQFKEWLIKNNIDRHHFIIKQLIEAIRLRTTNMSGELIQKELNLIDKELWLSLVEQFLTNDDKAEKKKHNSIIIRRTKSIKKNNYGKDISISI